MDTSKISSLKEKAYTLNANSILRKPIVLEFCGSPKSGKSTCIEAVKNVLRECKYNVYVIHEKAKICPITNKFDPMFNFWTVTNTINELMEIMDRNYMYDIKEKVDVILIDRGIYDSLIWFKWLELNNAISRKQFIKIYKMLSLDTIKRKIDKIFIFESDTTESLNREPGSEFTNKKSIIMNTEVLNSFNDAMSKINNSYGRYFNCQKFKINENWDNQLEIVTQKSLEYVIQQYDEQIGCIKKSKFSLPNYSCINKLNTIINDTENFEFKNRVDVEDDYSLIQLIPIAVIVDRDSILCVKKTRKSLKDSSKYLPAPEKNKDLFYIGGHVRKEDANHNEKNIYKIMRNALHREMKEEINFDLNIPDIDPFVIYSNESPKSQQHIACCWIIEIGPQKSCIKTNGTELMRNRTNNDPFVKFNEISDKFKLEAWSRLILTKLLNDRIPKEIIENIETKGEQFSLF